MEKKLKRTRKSQTQKDIFRYFDKRYNEDKEVNYLLFKEVLVRFNKKISDAILMGHTFNPKFHLGKIRIKKIKRTFKSTPPIDWAESRKLQKQGVEKYLVYFTDPYWYRWYWEKKKCTVKNKTVYSFQPTVSNSTQKGNRNKLKILLKTDPLSHLRFAL